MPAILLTDLTPTYRISCLECSGHGVVASPDSIRQGHTHSNDPDLHVIDCPACGGEPDLGPDYCCGCDAERNPEQPCDNCDYEVCYDHD